MHAVSDALFAGVYPLLPLIASDLHLSYGQVGAVKAILGGASALLQVPAGMLAETVGEHLLLAAGTGAVGLGLIAMAATATFIPLLIWTALAGIGGNTQHPVANALVSPWSMAFLIKRESGSVAGAQRPTSVPSRPIRNFAKFHSTFPGFTGCVVNQW